MEGAAMKNSSGELLFHPQKGILNYVNHKKETPMDENLMIITASFYITSNYRWTTSVGAAL
jgi:hypothetical protein